MSEGRATPPFWRAVWAVFSTKKVLMMWFFIINVVFGAMGVWAPMLPPLLFDRDIAAAIAKLVEVLQSGGAYTFAIAYLAATSGYLVTESLENGDKLFKHQKIFMGGLAIIVVLVCVMGTDHQFSPSLNNNDQQVSISARDEAQLLVTLVALLIGFVLAIIQWAASFSLDAAIDQNQSDNQALSKKTMAAARAQKQGGPNSKTINGKTVNI